ncbi:MAG: nucleotidyltransferase domain-containing protein [bacterium]
MVKRNVPKEIIKLVSEYGKLIKKHGIIAEHVVLFGSYARNLYRASSDIDVCIVSKICKDEHAMQVELSKLTYGLDTRIQPHPVSLADYIRNANPFISEIQRTGIVI